MPGDLSAPGFVERITALQSDAEREKIQRYFKTGAGQYAEGDQFLGVRMGDVFRLAKESVDMPLDEIEQLLESPIHEIRAGAVSIMDKRARRKRTSPDQRADLYALYRRRIDRINNWDLVDLGAPFVVGGYLFDKARDDLYQLAGSSNLWERRTAIVSTAYFIRHGDLDDTFRIAEMLIGDDEDLIHKPAGGWLREAGKQDPERLRAFLDDHARSMPRTMLRYATERLAEPLRRHYRKL